MYLYLFVVCPIILGSSTKLNEVPLDPPVNSVDFYPSYSPEEFTEFVGAKFCENDVLTLE